MLGITVITQLALRTVASIGIGSIVGDTVVSVSKELVTGTVGKKIAIILSTGMISSYASSKVSDHMDKQVEFATGLFNGKTKKKMDYEFEKAELERAKWDI